MHYSRYYESLVPYHCRQTLLQKKESNMKISSNLHPNISLQNWVLVHTVTLLDLFSVTDYIFRFFIFKINVTIISFNMKERHYSLRSDYHPNRNGFRQY